MTEIFDGAPVLEVHLLDGPAIDPALGGGFSVALTDPTVELRFEVSATPDGRASLLLTMPDATGASLGALMTSVPTPTGDRPSTGVDVTGVPPDVSVTAQRIYDGARAHDFDALAQLLDPNTFVYNFDDGSDPIPAWRQDPRSWISWSPCSSYRPRILESSRDTAPSPSGPTSSTATSPRSPNANAPTSPHWGTPRRTSSS